MHRELIIEAFRKAEDNLRNHNGNDPSTRQMAMELSNYLTDDCGFSFGERRLRDYYNAAENSEDVNITQKEVIKGLCNYLHFDNYQEYLESKPSKLKSVNTKTKHDNTPPRNKRNISIIISISFGVLIGLFLIFFPTQQKWMVWKGDHYEEVQFDSEELANGSLKLYKEDRVENFKQIKNADCSYQFFNADGSVRVWYGKNKNGELELFTDIGLHPETGKSLKPITVHMIRNYICETY